MYPLNLFNPVAIGYAVAFTEDEHKALTAAGYEPALVGADPQAEPVDEKAALRAELDAKGIAYDARWGVDKLRKALG